MKSPKNSQLNELVDKLVVKGVRNLSLTDNTNMEEEKVNSKNWFTNLPKDKLDELMKSLANPRSYTVDQQSLLFGPVIAIDDSIKGVDVSKTLEQFLLEDRSDDIVFHHIGDDVYVCGPSEKIRDYFFQFFKF